MAAVARIVGASLAYLAVLDIVAIASYGLGQTIVPDPARATFGLVGLGVAEGAAMAAVFAVWRIADKRALIELGLAPHLAPRRALKGAAIASVMMGVVVLVGYALIDGASWDVNSSPARAVLALVGGLIGFLIQGPAEEVLFRGYILENVRDQWGVPWAVGVSTVSFALIHVANPAFGLLPLINLLLFGLGTALYKIFLDGNQLWGVFAIHAIWNWLQQVVFGLPNSGIASVPDNALFTVTPDTSLPDLFWGGGFGPEGTILGTLVLLAFVGAGLRAARRSGPARPRSG